jgi:hypothetical protein
MFMTLDQWRSGISISSGYCEGGVDNSYTLLKLSSTYVPSTLSSVVELGE